MKATTVAAAQPISEMISARRRSSRCSTMDMRPSGSRAADLRRPLVSRAIERGLALLFWFGRPRRRVDRRARLGRARCGRARLLLADRRLHLFGDLRRGLAELADAASDRPAELGQFARSEDDQDDG